MPNIVVYNKVFTFDKIIYADGVNGLDTNDGLSELTPVKTLAKATSLSTNSNTSCIYLLDGEFTSNMLTINGCLIGKPGKFPIITYTAPTRWNAGIVFNTPNSIITRIIFKATGIYYDPGYHFNTGGVGITIANCVFYNFIPSYTWFGVTNQITIKNCYFGQGYSPAVLNSYSGGGFTLSDNLFKTESDVNEIYYPINILYRNVGVYSGELSWSLIKLFYTINTNYINSKNDILTLKLLGIQPSTGITPDLNSFKIKINNEILYENPITSSYPQSINIPLSLLTILNNINTLYVLLNNNISITEIIYYEGDGLLNPIVRDFKTAEIGDKSNVALNPGTGISLTNQNRQGSIFTDISVYKKAEVKKVTVDGDNDKVITGNYTFKPNYIEDYFFKNAITRSSGSRFTAMNYQFSDILYMKECIELPGNTTMTDNNDNTATVMTSNSTRTWLLASAEILSLYVKPNGIVRIDIYNSLNTIIYTNTIINIATTMTINKSDICKIVITNINGTGLNLFTVSAIGGYDSKKFHLYSNPKYNIYSPININTAKLVLEDIISPTKDLVKSKKMGNLVFINNPSKVVVKKTSTSSNQTSSKIVRNKIDLANIPMRKIEVK